MNKLRKAFIVGVMAVTVLSVSMLAVPVQVGATAVAGNLIKMDGLSSVYYLGADGKRYVFPNEATYFSWYGDFSSVVTIPQSELESYPLGANVTMRPGTKLVKITTDPKVYAVEPDGKLIHVPSEAVAIALWGADWAKRVVDVPDAFFTNYDVVSGSQVSDDAYPTGSLVKFGTAADVYYIDADGKARKIANEAAFLANRFKWNDIVTSTLTLPTTGTEIAGAESALTDTSSGAGGTAGAGTGLSVAKASDTPEAGNIPQGSPVDFLKFNVTASSDGAVSINSVTLTAYDLGAATNIDAVTLYNDGIKLGTAKDMNSDRVAVFNLSTPLNVAAGTTETITVKATVNAASGNYALGIAGASAVATNGASVSGSFPIIGNTKAAVNVSDLGTVTLSSPDGTDTADVQFGTDDVLLASFNLTAANEAAIWESLSLRNAGTNNASLLENVRILIDGVEAGTSDGLVDRYVNFNMNNYVIAKNDTISVEVYGDMGIGNVGDTVELYLKEATDMALTGQNYGYGITLSAATLWDTAAEGKKITLASGDFTINMNKTATPAQDVRPGTDNVVLATIEMTSNGENSVSSGLNSDGGTQFQVTGTGLTVGEIENVELRDTDSGVIYDLTASSTSAGTAWDLSTSEDISFVKGVTRSFELRADLGGPNDTYPIDNGDTLQVTMTSGALSLTGDTSDASITNITPSSISGAITTVKTSSLTWTTTALTNKTVVPGATDEVVYEAQLKAGASSDVTLNSVKFDADDTNYWSFGDTDISKLALYIDGKLVKAVSNQISGDNTSAGYINFTSLSSNNKITKNTTVTLQVKADFAGSFSTTTAFALEIGHSTDSIIVKDIDNNTFAESVANVNTDSRLVTLQSNGTLKVELKIDDTKADVDTYLLAGAETTANRYLAKLVFTTANEPITVEGLVLEGQGTATNGDISTVRIYDSAGVMVLEEAPNANGDVYFEDIALKLAADKATTFYLGVVAKGINVDGDPSSTATQGRTVKFTLAQGSVLTGLGLSSNQAVQAKGDNSGDTITIAEDTNGTVIAGEYASDHYATSTEALITGAVLTGITNAMSDATLVNGTGRTIGKYTFVFNNGSNRSTSTNEDMLAEMRQLILTIATSSANVTNIQAYIEGNSANKTDAVNAVGNTTAVATIDLTTLDGVTEKVDGTVNLIIIGDVTNAGTAGDSIGTEINALSTDFTYNGNNGDGMPNFSNARLDISDVAGATLSN